MSKCLFYLSFFDTTIKEKIRSWTRAATFWQKIRLGLSRCSVDMYTPSQALLDEKLIIWCCFSSLGAFGAQTSAVSNKNLGNPWLPTGIVRS